VSGRARSCAGTTTTTVTAASATSARATSCRRGSRHPRGSARVYVQAKPPPAPLGASHTKLGSDHVVTLNPERDSVINAASNDVHKARAARKSGGNYLDTHRYRSGGTTRARTGVTGEQLEATLIQYGRPLRFVGWTSRRQSSGNGSSGMRIRALSRRTRRLLCLRSDRGTLRHM